MPVADGGWVVEAGEGWMAAAMEQENTVAVWAAVGGEEKGDSGEE